MAGAGAQGRLRRRHRRRGRPWARHRLLHGERARHDRHRGLDKGWLGGGNTGRNTTIIRSNYLWEESEAIYEHALKLWETLSAELNYNVMYSARGVMMLAHNAHDVQVFKRHVHANRLAGIDNEWLSPEEAKDFCPILNIAKDIRYPIVGAALQRRGGTARHDAVAWGYARGGVGARASTSSRTARSPASAATPTGAVSGVETSRGFIATKKIGVVAAGHTSVVMGYGRRAHAAGKLSVAGAGVRAGEADDALRRHVQHHPRLYVAVRQGRAGDRRRHRRLYLLFADRRPAHRQPYAGGDLRIVPDGAPSAHAAQLGRHRRRHAGPLADHRQDAGAGLVRQLRLGHRRVQGDAGLGPCVRRTRSPPANRTRSPRRSPSIASAPAV